MAKGKKKQNLSIEELLEHALLPEDEQPYEIPANWVWTKAEFGFEVTSSKRVHKEDWISEGVPFYRTRELVVLSGKSYVDNDLFISEEMYEEFKAAYGVPKVNDLLISGVGTIGVPYVIDNNEKFYFKDGNVIWFQNKGLFNARFIYYLYKSLFMKYQLQDFSSGTTVDTYTIINAKRTKIPLPLLAEQQRIVDRIESLFAKLDQAKELAQNALDSFETRKAAMLHKAFTGELTTKWREEHQNVVNTVLSDIALYADTLSQKDRKFILEFQASAEPSKVAPLNNWYFCSIGAIGSVTNGSTPSRKCDEYWDGDIPWVSSGEVRNNLINSTKEQISQLGYGNSSVKLLPVGTVLIAMIGEGKTRGQSAILEIPATTNQNVAAIVIDHGFVSPCFLWYWLQKEYQRNREKGNGTGPQALNCQRVRELEFIVPPLPEQQEIVRILDSLFEKEQEAKELFDIIDKIDLMKKAILARAFRGELGTNDPTEESAVELLKEVLVNQ